MKKKKENKTEKTNQKPFYHKRSSPSLSKPQCGCRSNQRLPRIGEAELKVFIFIKEIFMSSGRSCIQRVIWPLIFTLCLPKNILNFLSDSSLKRLEFATRMGKFAFSGQNLPLQN